MARYHAEINMSSKIMMISEDLGGLEDIFYGFYAVQFLPSAPLRAGPQCRWATQQGGALTLTHRDLQPQAWVHTTEVVSARSLCTHISYL